MSLATLWWIALPFVVVFLSALLSRGQRWLALMVPVVSIYVAQDLVYKGESVQLQLLDSFGVHLIVDPLGGAFLLTNAIVTLAVMIYSLPKANPKFFFSQLLIIHGSLNSAFICYDLISLYVALEVTCISAFFLISSSRTQRSIWVAFRYLFVSNVAMLFYLVGAVLVYEANRSFAFGVLEESPPEAVALIFLGLMVKGGVFVSGLWLPYTHSESESAVSAMLSGVVIKAGILPLIRFSIMMEDYEMIVRGVGVATATLGVGFAMFEKDAKRMLAFHTVSQVGFILAAPLAGGIYALSHGLVKSCLFLSAGQLHSRKFVDLKSKPISFGLWFALSLAGLSISGLPFFYGYGAKALTMAELLSWQSLAMNIISIGTAISFSKFIFLPHTKLTFESMDGGKRIETKTFYPYLAIAMLLLCLVAGSLTHLDVYVTSLMLKAVVIILIGWSCYHLIIKKLTVKLPREFEKVDHLIGLMTLMIVTLFWKILI